MRRTVRGEGSKGEITYLCIEGEQPEIEFTGSGEPLMCISYHPSFSIHVGQRTFMNTARIRDAATENRFIHNELCLPPL